MQKHWISRKLASLQSIAGHLSSPSSWVRVKEYFLSTPEIKNPSKLRDTLSRFILIRVIILSMLLGSNIVELQLYGVVRAGNYLVFWSIAFIYAISIINFVWIRNTTNPRFFGYCQLAGDVLLATIAIYVSNSTVSIALYLLIIVGAALVFSRHGAVIIAALSGLCYAFLASGLIPGPFGIRIEASTQDILVVYISLIAVALVSGYLAKQLEIVGGIADTNAKNLDNLSKQQRQLFNDISEGIITLDLQTTVTSINEAARAIIGLADLDPNKFIGKPLNCVLEENGVRGLDQIIDVQELTETSSELTLQNGSGEQDVHLSYSIKPLLDAEGNQLGRILIFDDISHLRDIQEQLDLHERMTKMLADSSNQAMGTTLTAQKIQMVGESQVMQRVFTLVERVAQSEVSVLVTGESGTGKELIAKAIHTHGPRKNKAFVAINCGAIPENLIESELFGHKKGSFTGAVNDNPGLFRQANGGTIFLDEIGELPLHLQTKLLRVLQDKIVRPVGETRDFLLDVRVIAATNKDLKKEIAESRFREDLYYRLNVVNIILPPLRDRREDIPQLVHTFIASFCDKDQALPQISPDALQMLTSYSFPGNVRELENIIERSLVLSGQAILPEHMPEEVKLFRLTQAPNARNGNGSSSDNKTDIILLPIDLEEELSNMEKKYLHQALEQSSGVKKHAAKLLGLNFRSFRYRMKKYGLSEGSSDSSDDNI